MSEQKSKILEIITEVEDHRSDILDRLEKQILDSSRTSKQSKIEAILNLVPGYERSRLLACSPENFEKTVHRYIREYETNSEAFLETWKRNINQTPTDWSKVEFYTCEENQKFHDQLTKDLNDGSYGHRDDERSKK